MNHSFQASELNPKKCKQCEYDWLSHSNHASCDFCSTRSAVDIIDGSLMCTACQKRQHEPVVQNEPEPVIEPAIKVPNISPATEIGKTLLEVEQFADNLMERARSIDASMKVNGDMFNAETIAHVDVKKEIFARANLTEDEKQFEYSRFLLERLTHYHDIMFKADQVNFLCFNGINGIQVSARELAEKYRAEVRDAIKAKDQRYSQLAQPVKKVKVDAPKKQKKSAFENLVLALMKHKGITETEAILTLNKGNIKSSE